MPLRTCSNLASSMRGAGNVAEERVDHRSTPQVECRYTRRMTSVENLLGGALHRSTALTGNTERRSCPVEGGNA